MKSNLKMFKRKIFVLCYREIEVNVFILVYYRSITWFMCSPRPRCCRSPIHRLENRGIKFLTK